MRMILLRAAHDLLEHRIGKAALNLHHYRLVILVADHDALQDSLRHCLSSAFDRRGRALALDGFDARDIATHGLHARSLFPLTAGALKAQIELLLLQLQEIVLKLVRGLCIYRASCRERE